MVHHYMEDHPDYDRTPLVPTVTGSIDGVDEPRERPASPIKPPKVVRQNASCQTEPKLRPPSPVGAASYGGPDPGDPFLDNLPLIVAAVALSFAAGMWMSDFISKPTVAACCE